MEAEPARRSPKKARAALRGACKDAAAQTDLTPREEDRSLQQPQRLDDTRLAENQSLENRDRYNTVSPMENTQQAPQFSADRAPDWAAPELSRYASHVEPDVGYQRFGEQAQMHGQGGRLTSIRQAFGETDMPSCGPYTHVRETASLLHPPPLAVGYRNNGNGHLHTYQSQQMDHPGTIPGNFGIENLEEFIRRIEGEAVLPHEEVADTWARPYSELEVLKYSEPRALALPQIANFNGTDDTAILSNRDWFALEGDLPAPIPWFAQNVSVPPPTLGSMQEPYGREEQEGYQADTWQQRNMF